MDTTQIVTKDNSKELAKMLWPIVCNILNVDPATVMRPEIAFLHSSTISLSEGDDAAYQGGKIYLADDETVYIGQLAHELAHAVIMQASQYKGQRDSEYLPKWVEEQIASV